MTANRSDAPAPVSAGPAPFATPDLTELLDTARRLADEPGLTARLATLPDQRSWLPLDAGPGTRAWLIAWPPGTGTGWHDHGGASGAMVAVEGELTERAVEAPRQHDYGRSLPLPGGVGSVRTLQAGEGRAFSGRHIHEVTNESDQIAFSVHVYAPNLDLMRHYAVTGENLLLVGVETEQNW